VDPLGLFESSPLVNSCEQDEKVVETTRKLVALMSNQLGTADGSTDLADLQRDEVLELSAILGRKVWDRRVALLRTSNRFARKLLDVTAFRLESAERVARPQRTRRPEPFDAETVRDTLPSGRLSAARSRLNALIDDRKDNAVVAEEALPVRTTL
jgi:hypothetical protein